MGGESWETVSEPVVESQFNEFMWFEREEGKELREYGREEWARAAVVRPAHGGGWNESASMVNLICT
jgi:hypothetical protein